MENSKNLLIRLISLSLNNLSKTKMSSFMTVLVILFLFLLIHLSNIILFNWIKLFSITWAQNNITVDSEKFSWKDKLSLDTVDAIKKSLSWIKDIDVTYNFFFRIPTALKIDYANTVKLDTDIFFMAYDFKELKKTNYKKVHDPDPEKIWLILSSKALYLLNNTVINNITADTVWFLNWEIIFWKSSLADLKKQTKKPFQIEGISDDLPIYSLALDIDTALQALDYFWIDKDELKLNSIQINFKSKNDIPLIDKKLWELWKQRWSEIIFRHTTEDNEKLKSSYKKMIGIFVATFITMLVFCLILIFNFKIWLLIEKNRKTIKTLNYLGLNDYLVTIIYYFEYLFLVLSGLIFFLIIETIFINKIGHFVETNIAFVLWIWDYKFEDKLGVFILEILIILIFIFFKMLYWISALKRSR